MGTREIKGWEVSKDESEESGEAVTEVMKVRRREEDMSKDV